MAKWTRPRFLVMYALIPIAFLLGISSKKQFSIGVPIVCAGLLIRLWANGFVGHQKVNWTGKEQAKIGRLVTGGPYAFVRHPLYFGTFLVGLGIGIIVGRPWAVVLGAAALFIVYRRKIREEELTLEAECGEAFLRYKQAVPAWVPRLTPFKAAEGRFSWQGIAASKEWKTTLWVLAFLIALYLREEIWQEREIATRADNVKHGIYFAVLVVLVAADGIIEWRRHHKRRPAHP